MPNNIGPSAFGHSYKSIIMHTAVITGTTSGIGYITAQKLATEGYRVLMLVRNEEKGKTVQDQLIRQTGNGEVHVITCDTSHIASVQQAAERVAQRTEQVSLLINNAGGIIPDKRLTPDGYEYTFAMNHLGHFHLTNQLLPLLHAADSARIIHVSSEAHRTGRLNFSNLHFAQKYSSWQAYANAKLCNIYLSNALADRLKGTSITSNALHPGVVRTGFGKEWKGVMGSLFGLFKPFMITPEQGAATSLHIALSDEGGTLTGQYFKNRKPARPAAVALDKKAQEMLWTSSEELVDKALRKP